MVRLNQIVLVYSSPYYLDSIFLNKACFIETYPPVSSFPPGTYLVKDVASQCQTKTPTVYSLFFKKKKKKREWWNILERSNLATLLSLYTMLINVTLANLNLFK